MGRRRRVGLRRFMGPRAQDRRAEPLDPMLCRTALWGRAGRGDADGDSAALPAQDHRGDEAAGSEWFALPDPAVWHPIGCACGVGRQLWGEGEVTSPLTPLPSGEGNRVIIRCT